MRFPHRLRLQFALDRFGQFLYASGFISSGRPVELERIALVAGNHVEMNVHDFLVGHDAIVLENVDALALSCGLDGSDYRRKVFEHIPDLPGW